MSETRNRRWAFAALALPLAASASCGDLAREPTTWILVAVMLVIATFPVWGGFIIALLQRREEDD